MPLSQGGDSDGTFARALSELENDIPWDSVKASFQWSAKAWRAKVLDASNDLQMEATRNQTQLAANLQQRAMHALREALLELASAVKPAKLPAWWRQSCKAWREAVASTGDAAMLQKELLRFTAAVRNDSDPEGQPSVKQEKEHEQPPAWPKGAVEMEEEEVKQEQPPSKPPAWPNGAVKVEEEEVKQEQLPASDGKRPQLPAREINVVMCSGARQVPMAIGLDEPMTAVLARFCKDHSLKHAMFEWACDEHDQVGCSHCFCDVSTYDCSTPVISKGHGGHPARAPRPKNAQETLRLLFQGDRVDSHTMTARKAMVEEGDTLDVMIGQSNGFAHYPKSQEMFNTQEGALDYYAREVRRLRQGWQLAHQKAWLLQRRVHELEKERGEQGNPGKRPKMD